MTTDRKKTAKKRRAKNAVPTPSPEQMHQGPRVKKAQEPVARGKSCDGAPEMRTADAGMLQLLFPELMWWTSDSPDLNRWLNLPTLALFLVELTKKTSPSEDQDRILRSKFRMECVTVKAFIGNTSRTCKGVPMQARRDFEIPGYNWVDDLLTWFYANVDAPTDTYLCEWSGIVNRLDSLRESYSTLRDMSGTVKMDRLRSLIPEISRAFRADSFDRDAARLLCRRIELVDESEVFESVLTFSNRDTVNAGVVGDVKCVSSSEAPPDAEKERNDQYPCRHTDDFRTVTWYGTEYHFSVNQAACMKVLVDNWKNGNAAISGASVFESTESQSQFLSQVFKNHDAWKRMIISSDKGMYKLSPDPPQDPKKS